MSAAGGPFWKASVSEATRWTVHHIPSTDSDQVSPEWIEDRTVDWGVGSPFYQTRVMGEFADSGEGVLFPLPLLDEATCRDVEAEGDALGVDVARSVNGDWNCIARCRKGTVEIIAMWRGADTMETTQRLEVPGKRFFWLEPPKYIPKIFRNTESRACATPKQPNRPPAAGLGASPLW